MNLYFEFRKERLKELKVLVVNVASMESDTHQVNKVTSKVFSTQSGSLHTIGAGAYSVGSWIGRDYLLRSRLPYRPH